MRGIVFAVSASLAIEALFALCYALSQHSETAARYMALVLAPMAVIAVTAHRAGRLR